MSSFFVKSDWLHYNHRPVLYNFWRSGFILCHRSNDAILKDNIRYYALLFLFPTKSAPGLRNCEGWKKFVENEVPPEEVLPLPVCCWDWFPLCWLAVLPPFKFRFWKLLKIPGDKKSIGLLKFPGFWSWLVPEIPLATDDPEPIFENCEFPRFRKAEGSIKFCWKDPEEPLIPDDAPPTVDWKLGSMNCWGIGAAFPVPPPALPELKNEYELFVWRRILRMSGIKKIHSELFFSLSGAI